MTTQSEVPDISELTKPPERKLGKLRIASVQEVDPYINMLVYGHPGAGKTVFAGSASQVPEMAPVLLIDVEGGSFSLRERHPDVDVVRVMRFQEMQEVYDQLLKGSEYKTVILDSLTEIQRLSMGAIMRQVVAKEPDRDPEVPSIREWGKNGEQTRGMVRAFRDLPLNVVFTALAIEEKDQKTGKLKTRPSLSGKLSMEVAGYMDFCSYMYTLVTPKKDEDPEVARLMLTGTTDTHVAKDRSGSLPLVVKEPSMETIHGYIFNTGDTNAS